MSSMRSGRRGLTMIELLLSVAILSGLMVLVFQLIDRSLSVWRKAETRRSLMEQSATVMELLSSDLRGLEGGRRGDLLLEWVSFDTDGDGVLDQKWPRLRLVRQASAREVGELTAAAERAGQAADEAQAQQLAELRRRRPTSALVEVIWLIAPLSQKPDLRAEGVFWRGERLVDDPTSKLFFAADFLGTSGRPPAGATEEVTGGVLWCQIQCAAQTSILKEGWEPGKEPRDVAASWDARGAARPDRNAHPWNEPHASHAGVRQRPVLPRRVRIELEFERPADRERRTRLLEAIELGETRLRVDDGQKLPAEGAHILIDSEWMKVVSISGDTLVVQRAQRGTKPLSHAAGAMVHHGEALSREVVVLTSREDWTQ
jgi:prepilin-type N-terminal cleavage/methylation domain-containing protein